MKYISLIATFAIWIQAAHGQSTIAYFNGQPFPVPVMYGSKGVDFDGDGKPEFVFWSYGSICTADVPTSGCSWPFYVGAAGTNSLLAGDYALVQSAGALIGNHAPVGATWRTTQPYGITLAASWWSLYGNIIDGQTVYSGWDGSLGKLTNAYLGVRFQAQDGLHYGWIRVRLPNSATGPEGFPIEFTPVVVEWAFETRPDCAIVAGAKPVTVPLAAPEVVRPGQLRLSWQSEIGKAYQVQVKASLTTPFWTNLDFVVIGTSTNASVEIPITGAAKFFRVVEAD